MNSPTKVIGGFLAGAMIGVADGLLLAPESGQKTRKKLMDKSRELGDEVAKSVTKGLDTVKSTYNRKVDDMANAGKSTIDTAKERIKASN